MAQRSEAATLAVQHLAWRPEVGGSAEEVVREESEKSPMAKKVHASYSKFHSLISDWSLISEGSYYSLLG